MQQAAFIGYVNQGMQTADAGGPVRPMLLFRTSRMQEHAQGICESLRVAGIFTFASTYMSWYAHEACTYENTYKY